MVQLTSNKGNSRPPNELKPQCTLPFVTLFLLVTLCGADATILKVEWRGLGEVRRTRASIEPALGSENWGPQLMVHLTQQHGNWAHGYRLEALTLGDGSPLGASLQHGQHIVAHLAPLDRAGTGAAVPSSTEERGSQALVASTAPPAPPLNSSGGIAAASPWMSRSPSGGSSPDARQSGVGVLSEHVHILTYSALNAVLAQNHELAILILKKAAVRALGMEDEWCVYYNLNLVYRWAGRDAEAAEAAERSIALGCRCIEVLIDAAESLKSTGRTIEATAYYLRMWRAMHRMPSPAEVAQGQLAHVDTCQADSRLFTDHKKLFLQEQQNKSKVATVLKLNHDMDQLRYLAEQGVAIPGVDDMIANYAKLHAQITALAPSPQVGTSEDPEEADKQDVDPPVRLNQAWRQAIPYYNRIVHMAPAPALTVALNPSLDVANITHQYSALRSAGHRHSKIAHVDDLLTPEALATLRRFCLESTMWYEIKKVGYLGAYWANGFAAPLLLQIAEELRQALPEIFQDHPLQQMWAYKYDSNISTGIKVHADAAAVNVNFWITEDEANLGRDDEGTGGGLRIYLKDAPAEWEFSSYNTGHTKIYNYLKSDAGGANREVAIPYRMNRAVIFHSQLFHTTDRFRFRCCAYKDRRINITMLFGTRKGSDK